MLFVINPNTSCSAPVGLVLDLSLEIWHIRDWDVSYFFSVLVLHWVPTRLRGSPCLTTRLLSPSSSSLKPVFVRKKMSIYSGYKIDLKFKKCITYFLINRNLFHERPIKVCFHSYHLICRNLIWKFSRNDSKLFRMSCLSILLEESSLRTVISPNDYLPCCPDLTTASSHSCCLLLSTLFDYS